jgi:hypothetical protein
MQPIHFEIITYIIYVIAIGVLALFFRNNRGYWYALIGCTLLFPFEWIGFSCFTFLDYDLRFTMFFDRLPLMIPFAWGWFMGGTLILCLRFSNKLDAIPLYLKIIILYAIFWVWDFAVEYSSVGNNLWVYHWPKHLMIGGKLPWLIPFIVAIQNVANYFAHRIAQRYSEGTRWVQGFLIHLAAYYIVGVLTLFVGALVYWILGVTAFPFGPIVE